MLSEEEAKYREVVSAVEDGDNKAKTSLAWFKLSGCGGAEVDVDEAVALLEERVKNKDAEAMWMLGICCEYGMGCEQDVERAEELYKESSDCGSVIGQFLKDNGKGFRGSGIMKVRSGLLKKDKCKRMMLNDEMLMIK